MLNFIRSELKKGRHLLFFAGCKFFSKVLLVLAPLVLAKLFKPEVLGSYALLQMIVLIFVAFLITPLAPPFNIESNKEFSHSGKSNKTFTSFLIYTALALSIFSVAFLLFGRTFIHFAALDYESYKYIFILLFLGTAIYRLVPIFFLGQGKRKINAIIEVIFALVFASFLLLLYFTRSFNLSNVFIGYFVAGFSILLVSLFFTDYQRILPLSFSKENFKEIGHFSSWVAIGAASTYLINWGDNFVLKFFVPLNDIGVYNLAYQVFKGGILFSSIIGHYYTPYLSRNIKNPKIIKQYMDVKTKKMFIYVVTGFVIAEILAGPFIRFFGESYSQAIPVIRVLLISNLLIALFAFHIPIFNVAGKYKMNTLLISIQLLLNLILDVLFIRLWGIMGAALATTIAYLAYTGLVAINFKRVRKQLLGGLA